MFYSPSAYIQSIISDAILSILSCRVLLGRTHVKCVAEERKVELEVFLHHLVRLAPEVSQVSTQGILLKLTTLQVSV